MRSKTLTLSDGQHVHFLGYEDGRVEIRMPGNYLRMTQDDYREVSRYLDSMAMWARERAEQVGTTA